MHCRRTVCIAGQWTVVAMYGSIPGAPAAIVRMSAKALPPLSPLAKLAKYGNTPPFAPFVLLLRSGRGEAHVVVGRHDVPGPAPTRVAAPTPTPSTGVSTAPPSAAPAAPTRPPKALPAGAAAAAPGDKRCRLVHQLVVGRLVDAERSSPHGKRRWWRWRWGGRQRGRQRRWCLRRSWQQSGRDG